VLLVALSACNLFLECGEDPTLHGATSWVTARALHEQHVGEAADQQSQPEKRKPEIEDDMVHRLDVQHEGPAGNSKPLSRFCLSGSRRSERQKRRQQTWSVRDPTGLGTISI
jgi:hypothetical protein